MTCSGGGNPVGHLLDGGDGCGGDEGWTCERRREEGHDGVEKERLQGGEQVEVGVGAVFVEEAVHLALERLVDELVGRVGMALIHLY